MTSRLSLTLTVVLGLSVLVSGQFRTSTALVRLEVTVTHDDVHVEGLQAHDFIVEDRGTRPVVRIDEATDTPLDLVLVAPSVSAVQFIADDQVRRFAYGVRAFLDHVEDRDRLGVVLASPPPRLLRSLIPGRSGFVADAFLPGISNYAAPLDAIALGLRLFDNANRRRALVAFTNATDFRSVLDLEAVSNLAGRLGPAFVLAATPMTISAKVSGSSELRDGRAVGESVEGTISGSVVPRVLDRLAQRSGGVVINLGADDPRTLMAGMFKQLRTHYVISYEPPAGKGWHAVKVRVNRRGLTVMVREGYFVD